MSQDTDRLDLATQNTANSIEPQNTRVTAARQRTHKDDVNLAGPPAQQFEHSPYNVYFEPGYEEANPWLRDDTRTQEFSLAHVFPRTIRWTGRRDQQKPSHVQNEAGEEGSSEPATQVTAAEDQREQLDSDEVPEFTKGEGRTTPPKDQATHGRDQPAELRPFNPWAQVRHRFHRPLAEWLGTTLLVFIGCSGNLSVATSQDQSGSAQTTYWCWGFAVMLSIYVSGGGSGGLLNPALTIMLHVFRGFPARRITAYILAQCLGAFTGALLAFAVYRDAIYHLDGALLAESTGVCLYTQPQPWVSPATAFCSEFLGSAVIGCCILALGDSANSPPGAGMHALIIGLLITTCTMAFSSNTRGAFNPARDIGPRLAAVVVGYPASSFTEYRNWWIWGPWVACICGALAGGLAYDTCIFRGGESPVNYSVQRYKIAGLKQKAAYLHMVHKHREAESIQGDVERGMAEDDRAHGKS